MDVHLNFTFKQALHFSSLAIKPFNNSTKLQLLPQHYEPVFFRHPYDTPTFKTKHSVLLVMYNTCNAFVAILTTNTALP